MAYEGASTFHTVRTEMHNINAKLTKAPTATGEPQRVPPRNCETRRVSTAHMLSMLFRTSSESDRLSGDASSSFSVASDE